MLISSFEIKHPPVTAKSPSLGEVLGLRPLSTARLTTGRRVGVDRVVNSGCHSRGTTPAAEDPWNASGTSAAAALTAPGVSLFAFVKSSLNNRWLRDWN